jgi:hypothetical protein
MNPSVDPTLRNLNDCGCCKGLSAQTPARVYNRPGLTAIAYRVGTHSQFKQTMLAALSDSNRPALQNLNTRDEDDFSIALLDAWSVVADVLTFYQDRIANESYLRTATERRSVLEMAQAIGYELNPGVAAGTYLAFTLETAKGSPSSTKIGIGTKAQSVPGQDEKAQTFETIEEIEAQAEWNQLKPLSKKREIPGFGSKEIYLKGITTGLKPGDGLLMIGAERKAEAGSERWDFRRIKDVNTDHDADFTKVTWDEGLGWQIFSRKVLPAEKEFQVFALRQRAALFGHNAPDWRIITDSIKGEYVTLGLQAEYFLGTDLKTSNRKVTRIDPQVNFDWGSGRPDPAITSDNFSARWTGSIKPPTSGMYTFYTISDDGVRLWVNGQKIIDNWTIHAATENSGTIQLAAGQMYSIKLEYYEKGGAATIKLSWSGPSQSKDIIPRAYLYPPGNYDEWPGFTISAISSPNADTVYLDTVYPQITLGGWLVLSIPTYQEVYEVINAVEDSRVGFTLASKATRVKLKGENLKEVFDKHVRDTMVFAQSEELEIAEKPVTDSVEGSEIVLEKRQPDLEENRSIIISGKRIRAYIPDSSRDLVLTSADGSQTVSLSPRDSLVVMKTPETQTNQMTWTLMDKNRFVGTVSMKVLGINIIPAEKEDAVVTEVNMIKTVNPDSDPTVITLEKPLTNSFDRSTVVIYANVAKATHGESKKEILGSGDGSQMFQKFELKQNPLTYMSASTPSGTETTLKVRVNDLLWREVPTFYGHGPDERIYVTRTDDDGKTTVQFGDGRTGARLPTGKENVQASYRKGIGLDGLVKAEQISQLMTRPLGLKSVTNPLPATGAQDRESLKEARRNAPLTVLTLDRIVSLQDYEDFARSYAGIAKALATWTWDGEKRAVFVTVAGPKGAPVDPDSTLYENLLIAMRKAGDPHVPLQVESYRKALFRLGGSLKAHADYQPEKVLTAVRKKLHEHFSFDARGFGQPVTFSEVVAIIQQVPGVVAVFINQLYLTGTTADLNASLEAKMPQADETEVSPAQLLTLDPCQLGLEVIS